MAAGKPSLQIMDFGKIRSPNVAIGAGYVIYYYKLVNGYFIAYESFQLELEKVSLRKSTEPSELTNS